MKRFQWVIVILGLCVFICYVMRDLSVQDPFLHCPQLHVTWMCEAAPRIYCRINSLIHCSTWLVNHTEISEGNCDLQIYSIPYS